MQANPAWQQDVPRPRFDAPAPKDGKPQQTAESAESAAGEKARDYNAELSELLRKAVPSCLTTYNPSARSTLNISVTAQLMASGTVSSAQVAGTGLTPTIITCIQKLAATLRLRSPVDGAPRAVQVQLSLQPPAAGPVQPVKVEEKPPEDEEDQRDENPRDSKLQKVDNDPSEATPKEEPVADQPDHPDGRDEAPTDTHTDEQP